jgi:MFS family permease
MSTGKALAAVSSIGFLGFLLGPPLIGFIAGLSSLRFSFAYVALMGFIVTLIVSRFKQ